MGYSFTSEYVRRLADGDALVERHFHDYFDRLLSIKLRRKCRDTETIAEVRQETFLRVIKSLRTGPGLRDPRRLGAFVHSVCENVFREYARKVTRMPRTETTAEDVVDPGEAVDSTLARREVAEHVQAVLDELPESDRVLLIEVFLEGQDRNDVCQRRQVTREYLRVLLHRSKERFRTRFQDSMARQARALRRTSAAGGRGM